jgi:hypothetical protein
VTALSPDLLLQAAQQTGDSSGPLTSVLLLGAGGRLGEALLGALTANSQVGQIDVATVKPIEMGIARVKGIALNQLRPVNLLIVHLPDSNHLLSHSLYGRDAAFAPLFETELTALIPQLETLGVKRVVVVKPLSVYQQMGGLARQLINSDEMQLYQSKFESITFIRPAPIVEAGAPKVAGESFFKRLFGGYMRLNFFTLPKTFEPVRTDQLAPLIIDLALQAEPGLKVFTADQLRVKLEAKITKA